MPDGVAIDLANGLVVGLGDGLMNRWMDEPVGRRPARGLTDNQTDNRAGGRFRVDLIYGW